MALRENHGLAVPDCPVQNGGRFGDLFSGMGERSDGGARVSWFTEQL
jgi:hypothetical protein